MPATLTAPVVESECVPCLVPVSEMAEPWYMCMTIGGMEKRLARELAIERVNYYLPLNRVRKLRKNGEGRERWVFIYQPLFPSYIFLNGPEARDVASVSRSKRVIYPLPDRAQAILQRELENFYRVLQSHPMLDMGPAFKSGELVRVTRGPLEGITGRFDRADDHFRVWINSEMMGQGAPLSIPMEWVERI